MSNIFHIKPIYKEFIWGGRKLIDYFHLPQSLEQIGTIYHVIAVPGHLDNLVEETGEPLSVFYQTNPALFRCNRKDLPIRMTTTCNEGRQSYQLHPTDDYALAHDGQYGKVSGSVALLPDGAEKRRLFGNLCTTREEFAKKVRQQDWEHLFGHITQINGDLLHTPAGVIHGGEGDGTITCTFSSNGDLTYRFFDYGRNDPKRPLEIDKVIECANIPELPLGAVHIEPVTDDGLRIWTYYDTPGEYTARRIEVCGQGCYESDPFYFVSCVAGEGSVGGLPIQLGETLLVPAAAGPLSLCGSMTLIQISYKD